VDILNYALPGSDQDGSILQYLLSEDYDIDAPPKIIIWELPASYHLDEEKIYRQLIPAVKGGCESSEVILEPMIMALPEMAKGERLEILSNTGANRQKLNDSNGFIDLKITDRNIKDFYLISYFDTGERDKVWFRRANIVDGGQYYLEISKDARFKGANLLSVFFEPSEPVQDATSLEVAICR